MKESFIISGMGRSGTLFLRTMMDRSAIWTVEHEPPPRLHPHLHLKEIQDRFDRNHYGEVNSYLRDVLFDLKVRKKGVIRRNPANVFLSICNWEETFLDNLSSRMENVREAFEIVDRAVQTEDIYPIVFEEMTSNAEYINRVIGDFGIPDVRLEPEDLKHKIHQSSSISYREFDDLPCEAIDEFRRSLAWFSEKYGYQVP